MTTTTPERRGRQQTRPPRTPTGAQPGADSRLWRSSWTCSPISCAPLKSAFALLAEASGLRRPLGTSAAAWTFSTGLPRTSTRTAPPTSGGAWRTCTPSSSRPDPPRARQSSSRSPSATMHVSRGRSGKFSSKPSARLGKSSRCPPPRPATDTAPTTAGGGRGGCTVGKGFTATGQRLASGFAWTRRHSTRSSLRRSAASRTSSTWGKG
mmetsp:Transcript_21616/g.48855  ORF Transcript_21616/g.48855 Transcript_21616/m.48855 type:complete len:209 (+) Transcript_21616:666-1292(+)